MVKCANIASEVTSKIKMTTINVSIWENREGKKTTEEKEETKKETIGNTNQLAVIAKFQTPWTEQQEKENTKKNWDIKKLPKSGNLKILEFWLGNQVLTSLIQNTEKIDLVGVHSSFSVGFHSP